MPWVGRLKLKAQLFCGEEIAMGPGKADLLAAIAREGSIAAAGRALGMSYRRAWLLVDSMNRSWTEPLVEATPGARRGARLTNCGEQVLEAFRRLEGDIAAVADGLALRDLEAMMRSGPRGESSDDLT